MPKVKPSVASFFFDFVEGLFAKVTVLKHFSFGLHRQLTDGGDVGVVQAIGGPRTLSSISLTLMPSSFFELGLLFVLLSTTSSNSTAFLS